MRGLFLPFWLNFFSTKDQQGVNSCIEIIILMIMNYLNKLVAGAIAMMAFTVSPGCSNEEQLSLDGTAEARTPLSISVSNSLGTKVGGGSFWKSVR